MRRSKTEEERKGRNFRVWNEFRKETEATDLAKLPKSRQLPISRRTIMGAVFSDQKRFSKETNLGEGSSNPDV
jgi:hypothetical protein